MGLETRDATGGLEPVAFPNRPAGLADNSVGIVASSPRVDKQAAIDRVRAALPELVTVDRWVCWRMIPDPDPTKKPRKVPVNPHDGEAGSSTDSATWGSFAQAAAWYLRHDVRGLGFVLGDGWAGVDLDDCADDDGNLNPFAWGVIERMNSYTELSPSGHGVHILVRSEPGKALKTETIEVYSRARYFTCTGRVVNDSRIESRTDELQALVAEYAPKTNGTNGAASTIGRAAPGDAYMGAALVGEARRVATAIDGTRNDTLNKAAFSLATIPDLPESVIEGALLSAAIQAGLPESEASATIDSGIKAGRLHPRALQAERPAGYHAPVIGEPAPAGAPQADLILHTDLGNGRRFALRHANKAAHVSGWGWMVWDGRRWEPDETGAAVRMARDTVRGLWQDAEQAAEEATQAIRNMQAAQDRGDDTTLDRAKTHKAEAERRSKDALAWALKSQGSQRIDAMLKLATSEPEIAARVADFDCDPWALNTQNGILDLRTGNLRAHDPGARLTKIAGAAYDPGASCPTWLGFLDRIFARDQTMIDFVQRAAGYSLSGDVREQTLFFLYGTGANGKSVFTGALQDLLGDYAMKTRAETLMVKHGDSIPEEVAQMAGARFLLAAELEENKRLNESLVKDLTGGDRVRARLLYQRSFEFAPTAKPWLYGNHKPVIRGTDLGIWRRVALIPFGVTIPEAERDKALPERLRAELPGILAWAVRGCLAWQSAGLAIPEVVRTATADYRHEQDSIGVFLAERCILAPEATVTAGELHAAYMRWVEVSHERGMSQRAFSQDLATNHGFVTEKDRQPKTGRMYYRGLGLLENTGL